MTFLFPLGVAAAGALIPLVVLYLLKQKRMEVQVPTNFLWERALEDLRASSLFQRLRTQLLLLLQALAILLFALAAAGASLQLDLGEKPRRVILVIDRSRSMQATDEGERTRFEVAQELALDAVSNLRGGDELMIIAFDATAEVVQSFTGDEDRLEDVISALRPRDMVSNAADALLLVQPAGAASGAFEIEVVFLSDGALQDSLPDVPYPVQFAAIGKDDSNQGISSAFVARMLAEPAQLFVRVDNGDDEPAQRRVMLSRDGELIDAREVNLDALGERTVFFELPELEGDQPVHFLIELDGKDILEADDHVDVILRPQVPRSGLLVAAEPSIYFTADKLSGLHPGLTMAAVSLEEAEATFAEGKTIIDLVVFDGIAPTALPSVPGQIYVNAIPPDSGLSEVGRQEHPIIVDWDRSHATTVRCQFDDVQVRESMKLRGAERSAPLLESTGGPLILLTPVPGREVVVVAFSPSESNLPLKLAWPLFLSNTMDFLLQNVEREGEQAIGRTGEALRFRDQGEVVVTTPDGSPFELTTDEHGRAAFTGTQHAGIYSVTSGLQEDAPYAVALLEPNEVRIAPVTTLTLGASFVKSNPGAISRHMLLRDPLLLLALGILVLEWVIWCGRR